MENPEGIMDYFTVFLVWGSWRAARGVGEFVLVQADFSRRARKNQTSLGTNSPTPGAAPDTPQPFKSVKQMFKAGFRMLEAAARAGSLMVWATDAAGRSCVGSGG